MSQTPEVEVVFRVGISPVFALSCGDGGKFCVANRSITRTPLWMRKKAPKPKGYGVLDGGVCIFRLRVGLW